MLITPYFDPDFSMAEFKEGAKHAAVLIANSLAEGDLDQVQYTVYNCTPSKSLVSTLHNSGCCCCHTGVPQYAAEEPKVWNLKVGSQIISLLQLVQQGGEGVPSHFLGEHPDQFHLPDWHHDGGGSG